jgi:hypothetical protein
MDYKNLYLKYKTKYLNLKEQSGGGLFSNNQEENNTGSKFSNTLQKPLDFAKNLYSNAKDAYENQQKQQQLKQQQLKQQNSLKLHLEKQEQGAQKKIQEMKLLDQEILEWEEQRQKTKQQQLLQIQQQLTQKQQQQLDEMYQYIDRVHGFDKDIVDKAILNIYKNQEIIIPSKQDIEFLDSIKFKSESVYLFIFSYLIEYGFNIDELNIFINKGIRLGTIIDYLSHMNGITLLSNKTEYIKMLIDYNITDFGILTLLQKCLFENNILLNSVKLKTLLKFLDTIKIVDIVEGYRFFDENKSCSKFIINIILNNPQITLEQLINLTKKI